MKTLTTIMFLILTTTVYSQKTGDIMVITVPRTAIIRLDTTLLKSNLSTKVKPGDYTLKMWSPRRELFEQKVTISQDSSTRIIKTLLFDDEYLKYQKDRRKYRLKRFTSRYIPIPLFVGLSVLNFNRLGTLNKELDSHYNNTIDAHEAYSEALYLDEIEIKRNSFNYEKEEYNNTLKSVNIYKAITYGTIAIGTVVSWYLIRYSNKLVKPSYEQKTLLSKLNFNYRESYGVNSLVVTCNF
jgi:hypothetical protein